MRTRVFALACTASILATAAVLTPSGDAGSHRPLPPTVVVNISGADRDLVATVDVSTSPRTACSALLRVAGQSRNLGSLRSGPGGGGQWSWLVGGGAPRGNWHVSVTCSIARTRLTASRTFGVAVPTFSTVLPWVALNLTAVTGAVPWA